MWTVKIFGLDKTETVEAANLAEAVRLADRKEYVQIRCPDGTIISNVD